MGEDHSKFAALILSHGRPDRVITLNLLRNQGYTGDFYLIVDDEDSTVDEYRECFGTERVIVFDKKATAETFDTADTQSDRRTIVYARNAAYNVARDLGLDYFLELDDDYTHVKYRYVEDEIIRSTQVRSLDALVEASLTFLDDSGAAIVAWSQGGDHMGGIGGQIRKGVKRKAMNWLFCRTDRPVTFIGRINEDVNTYVVAGSRGDLFLTTLGLQFEQMPTQQNAGGMTDIYLASGTYVKSFYTVMMAPSCVKIRTMGRIDRRMHHSITWDHAVPKILSPRHRKART